MHTGDGIQRVSGADAFLTPLGGEGGSVLQALGSKAEERGKRRKKKKDSYASYLESSTWRKIRARALKRDKHKCRACGEKAEHVHHMRYPKNLGQEKMEWLFSLCANCHNAIHRAARTIPLRQATDLILNGSRTAVPERNKKRRKIASQQQLATLKIRTGGPSLRGNSSAPRGKRRGAKKNLTAANDELHAIFKANRERRESRMPTHE